MNERVIDTAKVIGANVSAVSVSVIDFNGYLTTFSLVLAIGYTIWKWKREYDRK